MKHATQVSGSILGLAVLLSFTACSALQSTPIAGPVSTVQLSTPAQDPNAAPTPLDMANPASAFCVEQGYKSEIRTAADGSQTGYCIFPGGSECDEWAYFREECGPSTGLPTPKFVEEPLAISAASVPIPFAVLVNTGDGRGITAYDRAGLVLGEWQTAPLTGQVHAASPITDGITSTPLFFWHSDAEQPGSQLSINMGGNITPLFGITEPESFTDMAGLPANPMISYSTLRYEDHALLRSTIHLAEYPAVASSSPLLVMDSRESEYITPLAIRMAEEKPAGIWFTSHKFGIGGTPALYTNNFGLYYFDISANTIYTFLEANKALTDLSPNQAYAAWVDRGSSGLQVTDLIQGQTISFPMLPASEKNAGLGMVSPSGGYVAWQEGIHLIPGVDVPVFTVRIGTMDGTILAEYPHATFAKTSELGMETNIQLLGWLSDETLLVGVDPNGKEGNAVIVAVNVNTNEVSLFARGEFAGFAYP